MVPHRILGYTLEAVPAREPLAERLVTLDVLEVAHVVAAEDTGELALDLGSLEDAHQLL